MFDLGFVFTLEVIFRSVLEGEKKSRESPRKCRHNRTHTSICTQIGNSHLSTQGYWHANYLGAPLPSSSLHGSNTLVRPVCMRCESNTALRLFECDARYPPNCVEEIIRSCVYCCLSKKLFFKCLFVLCEAPTLTSHAKHVITAVSA